LEPTRYTTASPSHIRRANTCKTNLGLPKIDSPHPPCRRQAGKAGRQSSQHQDSQIGPEASATQPDQSPRRDDTSGRSLVGQPHRLASTRHRGTYFGPHHHSCRLFSSAHRVGSSVRTTVFQMKSQPPCPGSVVVSLHIGVCPWCPTSAIFLLRGFPVGQPRHPYSPCQQCQCSAHGSPLEGPPF